MGGIPVVRRRAPWWWVAIVPLWLLAFAASTLPVRASSPTYVPILLYHYIRVNPNPADQTGFRLSVTPDNFHQQMEYLVSNHFNVVSLGQAVAAIRTGGWLPPRPVVLTFDDGYADFYNAAIPEMRRWGFSATSFVITGFVGGASFMTWTQIAHADQMGFTIGSHTVDHVNLSSVAPATAVWEMSQSKATLENVLHHPVVDLAYPYGAYDGYVMSEARSLGYDSAAVSYGGVWHYPSQLWSLSREEVTGYTTLSQYAGLVGGPAPGSMTEPPSPPEPAAVPGPGGAYHAVDPTRVLDTRLGIGGRTAPLGAGQSFDLPLAGTGGIPASGVEAVVLNVTVTNTSEGSFLTVYPSGSARPNASNLNWSGGQTIANLVQVKLGTNGAVSIYNLIGRADVVVDLEGYVAAPTTPPGPDGLFNPVPPARLLDTRNGTGGVTGPLGQGQAIPLQITGVGGVPPSGVEAVALNVTVTQPTVGSFVTVWPEGAPLPNSSNVNFLPGQTIPNRVIVKLGATGKIDLYNRWGSTHLVVDVNGWFSDATASQGSGYVGLAPFRILDTRYEIGFYYWPLFDGESLAVPVAGHAGVPAMSAATAPKAVVLNVTVTDTSLASFLTVWPDGASRPGTSDLNWTGGVTIPNLVVLAIGANGKIDIYNLRGMADVVIDVEGYYT